LYINIDGNILVGNFTNNELDGYVLIITNKGEEFCKFENGKKTEKSEILLSQNYSNSEEYKELHKFYEENMDTIKKYKFV